MITHPIYFDDLSAATQEAIWDAVREALLEQGDVVREEDEDLDAFGQRLQEEIDHYINTHNMANTYTI